MRDRVGLPYVLLDPAKVVAVVESQLPDYPVEFKADGGVCLPIAQHVIAFLVECRDRFGWHHWCPPLQSGVGNIANAVIAELPARRFSGCTSGPRCFRRACSADRIEGWWRSYDAACLPFPRPTP